MATHSSVLAWRIPGPGEPGGCRLWGHTESDATDETEQQGRGSLVAAVYGVTQSRTRLKRLSINTLILYLRKHLRLS